VNETNGVLDGVPATGSGARQHEANLPAEVRQQLAHEFLEQRGFVRVRELSDRFGVSTVTARNDLQALEERHLAHRVHGGAMPVDRARGERSFEEVAAQHAPQKRAIAEAAAALVSPGESILVDVGTTTAAFASALVARTSLSEVNVITNGLSIALTLEAAHPRLSIVVTGGTLRPKQHSLVDPLAGSMLKTLSVDTVFLGCNGLDPDAGVTNVNLPEADIKRAMIAASQRCIVLADSTKFGVRALATVCEIDDVDVVVTDSGVADTDVEWLRARGVDVIVA
jgi:DeoR family transcriptional regulator, aga operon transcriptional repressor